MKLRNKKIFITGGTGEWKGDVPKVRIDVEKINKLGWKPKVTSKEAIKKSIIELLGK